jgi:hypothetical protein
MQEKTSNSSNKKHDLRDQPSTSLRDSNLQSAVQDPQRNKSEDPRDRNSGPDIVKPGVGGQATGQTTRQ